MIKTNLKCCFCNAPLGIKTDRDPDDELFIKCSNPHCARVNFLILQTDAEGLEHYIVNTTLSKIKAEGG